MKMIKFAILLLLFRTSAEAQQQPYFEVNSPATVTNANLPNLIIELNEEQLHEKNRKKYIPGYIKQALNKWTGRFQIANPGKKYQEGCIVEYKWGFIQAPIRQLNYLGISDNFVVLIYKKGGFGSSQFILVFKTSKNKINDFWVGSYYSNSTKQADIIEYLKFLESLPRQDIETL
jgi:hypothetical protein